MADKHIGLRDLFAGSGDEKATKLAERRKQLDSGRQGDKKDWALNREFYKSNQYAFWGRNRIESLPMPENGDAPRHRVRLVSNQIEPGVQHWVAQLTKNKPIMTASPNTGSNRDRQAAQVAQDLYEHWWREFNLGSKVHSALTHAALSQGYWFITWDAMAGKSMKVLVGPDGQPILDDDLADAYREELEAQGLDPKQAEQVVYMGEISVKAKSGESVLIDPAAETFEDARYAIIEEILDPDEVKARYGVDVGADAMPGSEPVPTMATQLSADQNLKTVRRVYHGYFRPSPQLPKGRYVCWIEGPDKLLTDVSWPFPFNELPLVKFPGIEKPNSALDIPPTTKARHPQMELNRRISQIMEYANLTLKPQMIAPAGSLRQRLTDEPGAIFEYIPVGNQMPQWRDMPALPSYVWEIINWAKRELDTIYNRMPTQRDQLPARVDSSGTVDLIQEAVADQLSPLIQRLESALARAGMLMAQLAQVYYTEYRTVRVVGVSGATKVKKYQGSDLGGGFAFHAEAGSGLPRTREGKQNRIQFLLENQLIDPVTALKHMDVADMNGVLSQIAADEEMAERENDKLLRGEPINVIAMQQAIAAVEQGINPQTQEPLQSPDEGQMIVMQAAFSPLPYENVQAHLEVLRRVMTSTAFENYPPDAQQRFVMHYEATQQLQAQQQMPPPAEPPKVTMNLKATTSPPVAGEILRKAGIEVSDEQVAEEPLETWVTDSVDKPDADEAGNDPLEDWEKMLAMQHAEEKHQLQTAKAAHEAGLAHQRLQEGNQRMSHAEEAHAERVKQMRQPKAAPANGR